MDDLLQQGVTAYKAGDRSEARKIFMAVVKQNPESERGWGWMYDVSETDKERIYCLNQMLRVNPNNKKANQLLKKLTTSKALINSGGAKIAIVISVVLVCVVSVCGIGFLFMDKTVVASVPTVEVALPIEKIVEMTASAAGVQTAASYSSTPLSTSIPTFTSTPLMDNIPTATIFIFPLQTNVAQPTEYIYLTNTPFIYVQPTLAEPTLIVVPQSTSDATGGGCCKYCGSTSKPCGDSCISNSYSCSKPVGCACN